MSIFTVGRICVKLAGRDAGKTCVVVEQQDNQFVIVDGATRRRKVNVRHLEPLEKTLDFKDKATHSDVKAIFEKEGLSVRDTKPHETVARSKKQKKQKTKPAKTVKTKAAVKEEKKEAVKEDKHATKEPAAQESVEDTLPEGIVQK
jgi:large subunit ribosomal protein L14e